MVVVVVLVVPFVRCFIPLHQSHLFTGLCKGRFRDCITACSQRQERGGAQTLEDQSSESNLRLRFHLVNLILLPVQKFIIHHLQTCR